MKRQLAALLVFSSVARANPADVLGLGARAAAMGNASVAVTDDASANYYNPAALVRGRDLRIDLGYQAVVPRLLLNGRDSGVDATHGFTVGVDAPGTLGPVRLAFGAMLFLPDDRLSRVRTIAFSQPRWALYDNRTQRLFLAANLAVQIVPGLYLGAGLAFMARTQGTVDLKGRLAVTDTDTQSDLVTQIDVDLVAIRYPQAGLLWEVNRWLTVGISYRHSFVLQVDQGFTIHGNVGNADTPPIVSNGTFAVRSLSSDLFQPWQLTAGFDARLTRRLRVAVDATYARWSDFATPASVLHLSLDLGPQLNPLLHLPQTAHYPAPGFHDILIPRIGVEWRAFERPRWAIDLRAGYSYEPSPVPAQSYDSNYADADKHRFSCGIGVEGRPFPSVLLRPIAIDAHFATTVLPERQTRKVDPTDPVGDFTQSGAIFEMGVTTRWRF